MIPFYRLFMLALLLLTMALGLRDITANAIWLDETWSVYNAGGSPYEPLSPLGIVNRVATEDPRNAAPMYHLLLGGWGSLAGWSAFAIRYSSLLYGLLAVAFTYRLARDMASPLAGLGATVALGTSALFIYFTHELRTYMLATLMTPIAVWCYWRLIHARRPSIILQIGFVISLLGLLYTHYLAAVALAGIGLYHLLFVRKDRRWLRPVILMGIAGLLFLPWLGVIATGMQLNAEQPKDPGVYDLAQTLDRLIYFFGSNTPALLALTVGLAVFSVWSPENSRGLKPPGYEKIKPTKGAGKARKSDWTVGIISGQSFSSVVRRFAPLFFALVAIICILIAQSTFRLIVPGRERYLLMLWPLLAVVVGIGIAYPAQNDSKTPFAWRFGGSIALLFLWLVVNLQGTLNGQLTRDIDGANALPWDVLRQTLEAEAEPGDAAAINITVYNWALEVQTADYHLRDLPVRHILMQNLFADDFPEAVREFVDDAPNIWVGLDKRLPLQGGYDEFVSVLAGHYISCGVVLDVPRLRLDWYKRFPESAFNPDDAVMRFGDGIALTYVDVPTPQSGQPLRPLLTWSLADDVSRGTYSVALHVIDSLGTPQAQMDYGLPDDSLACRQTEIPVENLPAGDYTLTIIVYNWATGERLPGLITPTGEMGEQLPLTHFIIP
ncbi:MAG: glycosyltransferase family 39 protein [Anaerolineae bacterium]|nr:glycosyltransferase family 39 protein [Anaerolineae bacterium]